MENTTEKKSKELQEEQERCFVIMPISDQGDYPKGHFTKVYNQIFKPAIIAAGYPKLRIPRQKHLTCCRYQISWYLLTLHPQIC